MFGNLTLDVSMASIVLPNLIQGFGLGLLMVPLMAVAVGTLQEKIGNASGLFNLVRNLGGSIGISIATALCLPAAWLLRKVVSKGAGPVH
jgi:MFS transporter, DHA2 family, multidrug resistance protein